MIGLLCDCESLIVFHSCTFTANSVCVQAMLSTTDTDKSSDISFLEFVEYMREHERKLKLAFSDLDRNKDGKTPSLFLFYDCGTQSKWFIQYRSIDARLQ